MWWFEEVFLAGLELKYNERQGRLWLTTRQVGICMEYMKWADEHDNLYFDHDGKRYVVQVTPKGKGVMSIWKNGAKVLHT